MNLFYVMRKHCGWQTTGVNIQYNMNMFVLWLWDSIIDHTLFMSMKPSMEELIRGHTIHVMFNTIWTYLSYDYELAHKMVEHSWNGQCSMNILLYDYEIAHQLAHHACKYPIQQKLINFMSIRNHSDGKSLVKMSNTNWIWFKTTWRYLFLCL